MVFTSVQQRWQELFHRSNALQWNKAIATFRKEPLVRVIPPSELVYLIPDSPNVCTSLDPAKGYVIGCLIGENSAKGLPSDFAHKQGIRTERLPVEESGAGIRGFAIGQLIEVLVRVGNGADWRRATAAVQPVADEFSWCYHV
jgi:Trm5-related predicted tRNA methylase